MELNEAYKIIEKNLFNLNQELGFTKQKSDENMLVFVGDKGTYRVNYNSEDDIISFECAYDNNGENTEFKTLSRTLFETNRAEERDAKSLANQIYEEISSLFKVRKKVDLEKVKMPKGVSRSKAKNGMVNYDVDSLANRFGVVFPELKTSIKQNVVEYGEFLPETFFLEVGNEKVLDVIKNGSDAERKKMFKMFNEVFEDGTNEVQDIIAVTILGEMKNDSEMMAVADKYMSDYMSVPVHEINKITCKSNSGLVKKLKTPPIYKPKRKKTNMLANALNGQQQ